MFQATSRIESDNGIKFYEKDVLFDDYKYNDDIDIELTLDYINNGFGIMFINSNNLLYFIVFPKIVILHLNCLLFIFFSYLIISNILFVTFLIILQFHFRLKTISV